MPSLGRRGWIITVSIASVLIICVVLASVPATRTAIQNASCALLGLGCPPVPGEPGPDEEDDPAWRQELAPQDAATWGHYVALGDSYSSGDGADDYSNETQRDRNCYRSANAYPHRLAESSDFAGNLSFLACSGQRGSSMLENLDEEHAQLAALTPETSLVTIGIGGNDIGFSSVLQACMLRVPFVDRNACVGQEDEIEDRMEEFEDTFAELLTEVRTRAPDARVLVVGYPRIFPEDPQSMYYTLSTGDQSWLNTTIQRFNNQIRDAVVETDAQIAEAGAVGSVEFVDTYDALDGHEVSTDESWVNGVILDRGTQQAVTVDRATFHPTAAGQSAVGDRVAEQVEDGPGREVYVRQNTLDRVADGPLAAGDS
ncbi:SGNH/GDSL hydrolase family protein [Lipingzhangella sp. LS1_29]|uniref:SGNH/GDSL hydrolase family protein n=1 Tax=Lipingzhangella rawalii TaxID=2055835 RepID=A0ABU2H6Q9_9ACTN|nr:SGNH/GDSL hydrolase family protein [Lipingzhangella rawalii]MDS1270988.1 SGNH/GDSL hydrolase family protein [Lipingzhangella rawalii]